MLPISMGRPAPLEPRQTVGWRESCILQVLGFEMSGVKTVVALVVATSLSANCLPNMVPEPSCGAAAAPQCPTVRVRGGPVAVAESLC